VSTIASLALLLLLPLQLLLVLLLLLLFELDLDSPLTIFSMLLSSLALGFVLTGLAELRLRLLQPLLLEPVGEMLPIGDGPLFGGGATIERTGDVLGLTVSKALPMLLPNCDEEEVDEWWLWWW